MTKNKEHAKGQDTLQNALAFGITNNRAVQ